LEAGNRLSVSERIKETKLKKGGMNNENFAREESRLW
jgi:hypothetical protein